MVVLEFFQNILDNKKKTVRKTVAQYKQELLVRSGREQFQSLLQKNIRIPVVLL